MKIPFCSSDKMKINKKVNIFWGSFSWKQKFDYRSFAERLANKYF